LARGENATEEASTDAYGDAMAVGEDWLASRPEGDTLED
jgi:hypothetical protein